MTFYETYVTMPYVINKIVEANITSRRFERHQWGCKYRSFLMPINPGIC